MFDQLNLAFMLLNNSPEELVMKFRKREAEEELKEREASRAKVLEWMGNVNVLDTSVDMDVTVQEHRRNQFVSPTPHIA
jgi:hypothetical protein